jgi:hypothetical protein
MKQIISRNLRRLADFILFAAAINKEQVDKIVRKLEDILHNNGNFAPTEDQPLMFSPAGLEKIKTLEGQNFSRAKDMMGVLDILDRAMSLAAKTGNEQFAYVLKAMEKAPGKWLKMNLKGLGFSDAKVKVIADGLEYLTELLEKPLPKKTVTPEELQEMKERGVI